MVDVKWYTIVKCVFQSMHVRQNKKSKWNISPTRSWRITGFISDWLTKMVIHSAPSSKVAEENISLSFDFSSSLFIASKKPSGFWNFYLFPRCAVFYLFLQSDQCVQQSFGSRRTAGDININRNHMIRTFDH